MVDYEIICSWCGSVMGKSIASGSHGICADCFRQMMQIPNLSTQELDELPYGAIKIDKQGLVVRYNSSEEQLSHRKATAVIGRNFFTEIAPCTAIKEFQGTLKDFLESEEDLRTFIFSFPFPGLIVRVRIVFIHAGKDHAIILVKKVL